MNPSGAQVWVAGQRVHFERLTVMDGVLMTPVSDAGLDRMLSLVGAVRQWEPGLRYAALARADGKIATFTVGSNAVAIDGESQALPSAPFYRGQDLYVPLLPLAQALGLQPRAYRGGYVFVPQIMRVDRRIGAQRTIIDVTAAMPLSWRSSYDARHRQLIVRFPGFGSSSQVVWLGNRDAVKADVSQTGPPGYPTTMIAIRLQKDIRFSAQHAPSGVGAAIVLSRYRWALRLPALALSPRQGIGTRTSMPATSPPPGASPAATSSPSPAPTTSPPEPEEVATAEPLTSAQASASPSASPAESPSPLPPQKITDVAVAEAPNGTRITLTLTGPVAFEWHRLAEPDNRYWLDIPNATLVGPAQTLSSKLPFITEIKVSQHQVSPQPVVRVSITPTQPLEVQVGSVAGSPSQMGIEIENATPAPDAARSGIGTIALESPPAVVAPGPAPARYAPTHANVIVIDAGHGGSDPGAVNPAYGLRESALTLSLANRVQSQLQHLGWQVTMTRDGDYELADPKGADKDELQARCDVANASGGRIFVSIHVNSSVTPALNGTTTYYWRREDRALAQAIQNAVVASGRLADDGLKRASFYVIRHTWLPSALIEVAYLSNAHDAALLQQNSFLDKLATGIVNGLMDFAGGP